MTGFSSMPYNHVMAGNCRGVDLHPDRIGERSVHRRVRSLRLAAGAERLALAARPVELRRARDRALTYVTRFGDGGPPRDLACVAAGRLVGRWALDEGVVAFRGGAETMHPLSQ